jgi:hypothetical protein
VVGVELVKPAPPVVTAEGDDTAMGQVDEAAAVGEGALLAEQVAVVGGDTFVHTLGGDGAGQGQQRALHTATLRRGS